MQPSDSRAEEPAWSVTCTPVIIHKAVDLARGFVRYDGCIPDWLLVGFLNPEGAR